MGPGFFPLDDELALLPDRLSPKLYEQLSRLGTWVPFERAAMLFEWFTGVSVSEPTTRRHTQAAGAVQVARQTQAAEELEKHAPLPPPPAPVPAEADDANADVDAPLQISVDGAYIPLVGGQWGEVKTLAIGRVTTSVDAQGEQVVKTKDLSYFSRLAEAEKFEQLALVEIHRRGVERAPEVVAVNDGAEWIQGFLQTHCPDARHILDFCHAAGYVNDIGQAVWGADSPEVAQWVTLQLYRLKHEGPELLLRNLHTCVEAPLRTMKSEQAELATSALQYLDKRVDQMQYPTFLQQGLPIGSGIVESGQKVVVEARLKGAGMHWALTKVDPMLALRNLDCSGRWEEEWPAMEAELRRQTASARTMRREKRRQGQASLPPADPPASEPVQTPKVKPKAQAMRSRSADPARPRTTHKPGPNHPWRKSYKGIRPKW